MSMHSDSGKKRVTIRTINEMKGTSPITMITAYDALFAKLFDDDIDMILVGDSLNMSFFGKKDTLSADMDQMIYHTKAVCNGAKRSFVVFDMPFGSCVTPEQALENAVRVYRETCAQAVKIEGGSQKAQIVRKLHENGICVVSHIGLMPQSVRAEGGYITKGKKEEETERLLSDAIALEDAGASIILLEGMMNGVAEEITKRVSVPTIGIGAGNATDGQVLVWSDMFGFFEDFKPRFVKHYLNGADLIREALRRYIGDVKSRSFPDEEHSYGK